jgi:DNA helicase-2/ATP-dependent DNA helicase PcrA
VARDLNPAQQRAVEHDLGPLLVLAGAGSGKTRVVTERIARLIARGVPAGAILAVTFTNKAAREMHERVVRLVGAQIGRDLRISTFHRFGLDTLRSETRALGLRGSSFAIFDQSDSAGVVREILRGIKAGRAYDIGAVLARISHAKNAFWDAEEWADNQRKGKGIDDYDEIAMIVYPHYLAALRSFQAFDFDDLICEVVRLWRKRPELLARYRTRFRYLIIDEYQDTNHAQLELVRLLGAEHRNVCVVGDDDQSIYAWRGADVRNILSFEQHFPGATVIKLEQNYRSAKEILDVANAVLMKSSGRRHKKTLVAARGSGHKVVSVLAADPDVEASFVGTEVERLIDAEGVRPREMAVLYRSNQQSAAVEAALKERRIPLRMIGGQQFYERKEVKDLIAYLRLGFQPDDEMSLRRVINYPARGIGDAALSRLSSHATAYDLSLWAAVNRAHAVHDLPPAALLGCRAVARIVDATRARLQSGMSSAEQARALIADIGLKEDIYAGASSPTAAARRWDNIEGLLRLFERRDQEGKGGPEKFSEFLRLLALRQDGDEDEAGDQVTLSTIHGTKGLEYRFVFVIGLEEGFLPHARTIDERATDMSVEGEGSHSIEEERRLFYVAITRARDRLYLCRVKHRGMRGKPVPRTPSRFLLEIPADLLEEREEVAAAAPELSRTVAGAAGVLAALLGAPDGGEIAPIPRRPPPRRR